MKPGVSENAKTPYGNLYGCKKTLLLEFAKGKTIIQLLV